MAHLRRAAVPMGKKTADNKCPRGKSDPSKMCPVWILDTQGRHVLESTQICGSQLCALPAHCPVLIHSMEGLFFPE